MVGVLNAVVQITNFVVVHIAQVLRVEVACKPLAEFGLKQLGEIVDRRVDSGGRKCEQK